LRRDGLFVLLIGFFVLLDSPALCLWVGTDRWARPLRRQNRRGCASRLVSLSGAQEPQRGACMAWVRRVGAGAPRYDTHHDTHTKAS
jgi:hypothetical protein